MDFSQADENHTSAMSESNISGFMPDFGPKHSTPVKEYSTRRITSPTQPSLPDLHISALPQTWTQPVVTGVTQPATQPPAVQDPHIIPQHLFSSMQRCVDGGTHSPADSHKNAAKRPDDVPVKINQQAVEESVVIQQRREITLLIHELRERDSELNELVISHQHQLSVWEQDRQLILRLQHKCQRLEAELQTQQKEAGVQQSVKMCNNQERRHQTDTETVNDSLKEACEARGQVQAREQELITLLQIRETEFTEAQRTIEDLRAKLKLADLQKQDSVSESHGLDLWKQRCHALKEENDKLMGACVEKDRQLQQAMAQLQDTLQQALVLQQALAVSCEREKHKDELLNSLRARQERCNLELAQLRNLYRRQNREMTMLQLTLDTSKESDPEHTDPGSKDSLTTLNTFQATTPTVSSRPPVLSISSSHSHRQQSLPHHHSLPTTLNISQATTSTVSSRPLSVSSGHSHRQQSLPHHHSLPTNIPDHSTAWGPAQSSENKGDAGPHPRHSPGHVTPRSQNQRAVVHTACSGSNSSPLCPRDSGHATDSIYSRADTSNSNNNCSISSDAISPPKGQTELPSHQPAKLTVDSTSSDRHPPQNNNLLDGDEDGQRSHDVDTEAFWQKILSVRRGNENYSNSTKDLVQSSVKQWLAEGEEEKVVQKPADSGKSLEQTDGNTGRNVEGQNINENMLEGRHSDSPGSVSSPFTDCANLQQRWTRQGRMTQQSPEATPHSVTVRTGRVGVSPICLLEKGSFPYLQAATNVGEVAQSLTSQASREEPGDASPWYGAPAGPRSDQLLGSFRVQGVGTETHSSAAWPAQEEKCLKGTQCGGAMQTGHGDEEKCLKDTLCGGAMQTGHDGEHTDGRMTARSQFDERLSSFLETPEHDASIDPARSKGSCSPASKLHRLLLESQEMIKALEVRPSPDHL